ncbi:hypothetical protein [Hydrogenovibrio marinus]|uniref:Uncharacterized protein n=1 Tax=Hydrogenovibrio marinus TaxID=28885 RepID=A0A066ZR19_HYDMR|nr:hypothetical protein [Hydrogenovibrio marinus]KDN94674.1 hypothetical protein EI16_12305 [Hydrogenovibrio marinus]
MKDNICVDSLTNDELYDLLKEAGADESYQMDIPYPENDMSSEEQKEMREEMEAWAIDLNLAVA